MVTEWELREAKETLLSNEEPLFCMHPDYRG